MTLLYVTAVGYTTKNDTLYVQLTGRDEYGERRKFLVKDTRPYFYVPDTAPIDTRDDRIVDVEKGYESYNGISLTRVSTEEPDDVGELAEKYGEDDVDHWESDIPYYRRATMDYNLSGHIRVPDSYRCSIEDIETGVSVAVTDRIEPRILIGDIEVLSDGKSFDEMKEKAEDPITHITVWDSFEDEYVVFHLDPEGHVNNGEVRSYLERHSDSSAVSEELERVIHARPYETESALLEGFVSFMENRRPDITSGWNWVDFDWEYIIARLNALDIDINRLSDIGHSYGYQTERRVDCVPAFDMMRGYCEQMSFSEWRSKRLDYVAKEKLHTGKIPDVNVSEAFENDREKLVAYNIMDVILCVALDRTQGIHDFFYELAEMCGIPVYDTFSEMRLVDGYIMSRSSDDEILPPQKEKDIPENAGGLVLNPSSGVQEWTGVFDLKSLYPSVIITWNISPETIHWYDDEAPGYPVHMNVPWLPDADHAEGGDFGASEIDFDMMWTDMREEGLIPKYLKEMFPKRAEMKHRRDQYEPGDEEYAVWDMKQYAIKVIMNSFYGVMSNDYWRLGKYGLGDAVTSAARYALWKGKEICEDEGYEVIYGDTDSVLIEMAEPDESKDVCLERGEIVEAKLNERMYECVEESGLDGVHPHIDEELHGTEQHCLVYEFEKLYRRFFQPGKKKRYAGRIVWKEGKDDDDIDTVGFESQRSDSPELTEEVQPEVINMILSGDGFEEVSEYVQETVDEIQSGDVELYRIGLPKSVKEPLHSYGNTQTARACRYSNEELDYAWGQGDNPWVYFIDKTPPLTAGTDVVALDWDEELPEGFRLEYEETIRRTLRKPLEPILNEVNWRFDELQTGEKTQSATEAAWDAQESTDDTWDW